MLSYGEIILHPSIQLSIMQLSKPAVERPVRQLTDDDQCNVGQQLSKLESYEVPYLLQVLGTPKVYSMLSQYYLIFKKNLANSVLDVLFFFFFPFPLWEHGFLLECILMDHMGFSLVLFTLSLSPVRKETGPLCEGLRSTSSRGQDGCNNKRANGG